MENRLFRELAWFNLKETFKPMPRWWPVWSWFLILIFPMMVASIGLIGGFISESEKVDEIPIFMGIFTGFLCLGFTVSDSFYVYYIRKYKREYNDLKESYPLCTEHDFYLKVKSTLVKEWEAKKEKERKDKLERSNKIRKQYDL